ncbi:hypothetical protein HY642_06620 [Candidatus Woesearchaeota archaeon]|nr:hypothetical protein [Candidatus Woesearchaeota archaeon]
MAGSVLVVRSKAPDNISELCHGQRSWTDFVKHQQFSPDLATPVEALRKLKEQQYDAVVAELPNKATEAESKLYAALIIASSQLCKRKSTPIAMVVDRNNFVNTGIVSLSEHCSYILLKPVQYAKEADSMIPMLSQLPQKKPYFVLKDYPAALEEELLRDYNDEQGRNIKQFETKRSYGFCSLALVKESEILFNIKNESLTIFPEDRSSLGKVWGYLTAIRIVYDDSCKAKTKLEMKVR